MGQDDEWVANVKRWCLEQNAPRSEPAAEAPPPSFGDDIGYETAHPALQARHWPDAPRF